MKDPAYKHEIKPYLVESYPHEDSVDDRGRTVKADPRWSVLTRRRILPGLYALSGTKVFKDLNKARQYLNEQEEKNYEYPSGNFHTLPDRKKGTSIQ